MSSCKFSNSYNQELDFPRPEIRWLRDRLAPTPRGLGITPSTTSDNLTPQETTTQEGGTIGADGDVLSCPGSSVVADESGETDKRPQDSSGEEW